MNVFPFLPVSVCSLSRQPRGTSLVRHSGGGDRQDGNSTRMVSLAKAGRPCQVPGAARVLEEQRGRRPWGGMGVGGGFKTRP